MWPRFSVAVSWISLAMGWKKIVSQWGRRRPKSPQNRLQIAQIALKSPKSTQNRPKSPEIHPKSSKIARNPPQIAQNRSKSTRNRQNPPEIAQNHPKSIRNPSEIAENRRKSPKTRPKSSKTGQNRHPCRPAALPRQSPLNPPNPPQSLIGILIGEVSRFCVATIFNGSILDCPWPFLR